MQEDLLRLVYFSRNIMEGGQDAVVEQVEQILASARRNNLRTGVTGALLFNSGVFTQVLEGRREDIETTFKNIQQDKRHRDIQLLSIVPIKTRVFPNWSMGFLGMSRADQNLFGHMAEMTGLEQRHFENDRILKLLREIAYDEEANAMA
jgi:hypothetical protein